MEHLSSGIKSQLWMFQFYNYPRQHLELAVTIANQGKLR